MSPQSQMIDRRESRVRKQLTALFEATDRAVENALVCIKHHDTKLAQTIIDSDAEINQLYHSTEEECVFVIARMQPMARDLRELISDMQIAAELERIGDYAATIANKIQLMDVPPPTEILEAVGQLGGQCRDMLAKVWKAYEVHDIEMARETAGLDNEIDSAEKAITRQVFAWQKENPDAFMISAYTLWITHSLERIGDRATNIAERVVYIATSQTEDLN
ncbi:MAG: phosphate signaling complex protein PhoU [Pseudomonadota bacterium]|nr:phosphate signaling complex protein PhoU [Pseudomonadota bacterium]